MAESHDSFIVRDYVSIYVILSQFNGIKSKLTVKFQTISFEKYVCHWDQLNVLKVFFKF